MKEMFFIVNEAQEGGYTAKAIGQSIVTEAETIVELKQNIKEAILCHFDDPTETPKIANLHFVRDEILTFG